MKAILIVGIGSDFADDQVGHKIIDLLNADHEIKALSPQSIVLEKHYGPGLSLLNKIQNFNTVIIVDGVKSNSPLGTIHHFEIDELKNINKSISSHGFNFIDSINLAKALDMQPQTVKIFAIEIKNSESPSNNNLNEQLIASLMDLKEDIKAAMCNYNF